MKELSWKVKYESFNGHEIIDYDVLGKYNTNIIKKFKKKSKNISEFSEVMRHEFMWHYWSKCEWELIIRVVGDHIFLIPLTKYDACPIIEVTNDTTFDWAGFAHKHIKSQIFGDEAKIDVYDQLEYRWEEFINYCWYTRLDYERKDPKFEK